MAEEEELLTTPQAAAYVGMTRQALTIAAERGEIGRKLPAVGRKPAYVWVFTKPELDTWRARERNKGGRPKPQSANMSPMIAL